MAGVGGGGVGRGGCGCVSCVVYIEVVSMFSMPPSWYSVCRWI